MSDRDRLDRRQFCRRAARGALGILGGMILLPACEYNSDAKPTYGDTMKDADCSDTSMLSPAEIKTRKALKYVDVTADPSKACHNCKLYRKVPPCNACTLIKGPIAANGYCTGWVGRG